MASIRPAMRTKSTFSGLQYQDKDTIPSTAKYWLTRRAGISHSCRAGPLWRLRGTAGPWH